jgi:DDE superfamily endonuclease
MGRVAGCFPRRETRSTFRELTEGLLMELEDVNCWTLAEAVGHSGPHRLQHLLSRASWDDRQVQDQAAAWAVASLDDGDGILIADQTGDAKSSTDAVGAGSQYSGSLGGVGVCQVAVHLSFASALGHTVIDRAVYLPQGWAADEERREPTGVPEELVFATKPELATAMLTRAVTEHQVRAGFFAADEVYGSRALRSTCRALGLGYAIAVRTNHKVTTPGGVMTCKDALQLIPKRAWQRMRTGTGSKGARDYDWAVLEVVADDTPDRRRRRGCLGLAGPPPPLHPHRVVLPLLVTGPGPAGETRVGGVLPLAGRRNLPDREEHHWPGQRPGHDLDLLAPLEHRGAGRLRLPRRHRRPRTPHPAIGTSTSSPSPATNSCACSGC